MKIEKLLLTGFLFLSLTIPSFGAVNISVKGEKITAKTSVKGKAGLIGCEIPNLKKVKAYVFELMYRAPAKNRTCNSNLTEEWRRVSVISTNKYQVSFDHLPPGDYQIIAHVSKATGCLIKIKGQEEKVKSIVQEEEVSKTVRVTEAPPIPPTPITYSTVKKTGNTLSLNQKINIYPNPANSYLHIDMTKVAATEHIKLNLIDFLGNTIFNMDINNKTIIKIDLSPYPEGSYLLSIEDDQGNRNVQKLLILHQSDMN